jgi:anti-sigma B factor antagonist
MGRGSNRSIPVNIAKTQEGQTLTLALEGRLDSSSAPDLEQALSASPDGVEELVFDFAGVDYLSSAGLRVLLSAQKRMAGGQGSMRLRNVNAAVRDVLDMTGFSDFLAIEA